MGKNIIITSGTAGIGKSIVEKIAKEADVAHLIINYGHNEEAAIALKESLPGELQAKTELVQADMSEEAGLLKLVDYVKEHFDHIDWLICNTGIGTYMKFDEYTMDVWDKIIRTNVTIPVFLIQKLKNLFAEGGKIIFMASYSGIVPYSSSVVYGTSKAAVCFLAKTLVKEFDGKQVCINAIAPGFIETRWQDGRSEESYQRINAKIAAHRFGKPEEVAKITYDVLTNDYINGTVIEVTGGYGYFG
ncbi:MAG: SDR family oxidoreductase [Lachnospiraceae bacterium]|nr:SDR family oxidoreductase [Lachnospiraceae bacterium]